MCIMCVHVDQRSQESSLVSAISVGCVPQNWESQHRNRWELVRDMEKHQVHNKGNGEISVHEVFMLREIYSTSFYKMHGKRRFTSTKGHLFCVIEAP